MYVILVGLKFCVTFTDHIPYILTILICIDPGQEKNRINKDGELVISSTKTRTQKFASFLLLFCCLFSMLEWLDLFYHFFFRGNIEDALAKLQVYKIYFYEFF